MGDHPLTYPAKPIAGKSTDEGYAEYLARYKESIEDPANFWDKEAKSLLTWSSPYKKVMGGSLLDGDVHWFTEGMFILHFYFLIYRGISSHFQSLQLT
jgi:hypothetical protein